MESTSLRLDNPLSFSLWHSSNLSLSRNSSYRVILERENHDLGHHSNGGRNCPSFSSKLLISPFPLLDSINRQRSSLSLSLSLPLPSNFIGLSLIFPESFCWSEGPVFLEFYFILFYLCWYGGEAWIWLKVWGRVRLLRGASGASVCMMWGTMCIIGWWRVGTRRQWVIPSFANSWMLTSIACLLGIIFILSIWFLCFLLFFLLYYCCLGFWKAILLRSFELNFESLMAVGLSLRNLVQRDMRHFFFQIMFINSEVYFCISKICGWTIFYVVCLHKDRLKLILVADNGDCFFNFLKVFAFTLIFKVFNFLRFLFCIYHFELFFKDPEFQKVSQISWIVVWNCWMMTAPLYFVTTCIDFIIHLDFFLCYTCNFMNLDLSYVLER